MFTTVLAWTLVAATAWRVVSLIASLYFLMQHGDEFRALRVKERKNAKRGATWDEIEQYRLVSKLGGARHWLFRPLGIRSLALAAWSLEAERRGRRGRALAGTIGRRLWQWNVAGPSLGLATSILVFQTPATRVACGIAAALLWLGSLSIAAEGVVASAQDVHWGAVYHERKRIVGKLVPLAATVVAWVVTATNLVVVFSGFGRGRPASLPDDYPDLLSAGFLAALESNPFTAGDLIDNALGGALLLVRLSYTILVAALVLSVVRDQRSKKAPRE